MNLKTYCVTKNKFKLTYYAAEPSGFQEWAEIAKARPTRLFKAQADLAMVHAIGEIDDHADD